MDLLHGCVFFAILTRMSLFFVNYSTTWYNLKAQNKCYSPFRNLFLPPVSTIPKQSGSSDKGRTTKMATSVMRSASSHFKKWKGENYAIIMTLHISSSNAILHGCCFKDFIQTKLVTQVLSLNSCDFFDSSDNNTHLTRSSHSHTTPTTPMFFL